MKTKLLHTEPHRAPPGLALLASPDSATSILPTNHISLPSSPLSTLPLSAEPLRVLPALPEMLFTASSNRTQLSLLPQKSLF